MFQRILVANRGEIALRVIRACREMGIETVAVFSEADRGAHYLSLADEAYCIGPAAATDSYLMINRIISAAEIGNVQAIHPGYGFLAENAHFAEVCRSCNIEFIGPPHEAMAQLGDKVSAREIAKNANVPVSPGTEGLVTDEAEALRVAQEIGYPVLIKATAGGGGKGMRVARNDISLKAGLKAAAAEAEAAFKNAGVYIEKYIENPRHVEVQILADNHGTVLHLWERDCSLQRRHQKLVEESPAPNLPQSVREDICKAACRLIQEAGYTNAGTVEFLVGPDNQFYFIEVNARIQVEHPVSEEVTGLDLIKQQIRVAAGEKLELKQKNVPCNGSAIELRINAEDPDNDFRGSPGKITKLRVPSGPGVRFDSHIYEGYTVGPYYDSLIGKLIVHRPTREESLACMRRCLDEFVIEGIKTTIPLAKKIFNHSAFIEGKVDTTFIERTW
ncbi:acetyl-CoA carboxylase biotin carboxylase subunit [Gimesia chilikensis]|uniref:acetyl-CoA carboxylase biotin carboxylase subunit n=1 Tax=Gimesia chilikensis TaxID=2605989 RepID=UPI000C461875|nr:acetyl-CoA carboxylase biotin carboxylase subunit [Gimesia chilikensis]MBN71039.1 acetyl-CoA carboxylase biotin carboxylase subunit [Gimesia sp.]MCR9233936.1 acetyl-CoA carboxylase biotin carboxylase subunit [bacterium]QDT82736.1 Biotin carboxylase [Gimesia chilikensis]